MKGNHHNRHILSPAVQSVQNVIEERTIDNYRLQALVQKALADADVRLVIWVVYIVLLGGGEKCPMDRVGQYPTIES